MPELPRKPGLPLEEKAQIDPVAEAPTPRAVDASSGEAGPQGEAAPPTMPAPTPVDETLPIPPLSDDATPAVEIEEPVTASLPEAGKTAAIGAMSAAETAVRQRAEADYQRAIDEAIRAAQWRTDDAVYVGLVDEVVRLRGARGGGGDGGSPSSAVRAPGGDAAPWDVPRARMAGQFRGTASAEIGQRAEAVDGYDDVASSETDTSSYSRPPPYLTNATQADEAGSDDGEPGTLLAQRGVRRGGRGRIFTHAEELNVYRYNHALRQLNKYDPQYREWRDPNIAPTNENIAQIQRLVESYKRVEGFFTHRGISVHPHGMNGMIDRASRGISPEIVLRAYYSGRLYYDPVNKNYVRRDAQTGVNVIVTAPRGGRIESVTQENKPRPRWELKRYE